MISNSILVPLNRNGMKTITIEVNYFNNQNHSIHIGNCEWLEFKNKRFVRDYIVRYKRMLIDNVGVINNLYIQSFMLYRSNYFQFSERTIRNLDEHFIDFLTDFNMIFKRYSEGNNNAFVLQKIDLCFDGITNSLGILKNHAQLHKNYMLRSQVNTLIKMIGDLEDKYYKDKSDLSLYKNIKKQKLIKLVHKRTLIA